MGKTTWVAVSQTGDDLQSLCKKLKREPDLIFLTDFEKDIDIKNLPKVPVGIYTERWTPTPSSVVTFHDIPPGEIDKCKADIKLIGRASRATDKNILILGYTVTLEGSSREPWHQKRSLDRNLMNKSRAGDVIDNTLETMRNHLWSLVLKEYS